MLSQFSEIGFGHNHHIMPVVFKMKSYIVIVWLLSVSQAQIQNSVEDCTVFEQKSGELKPCEDVFVYENQTYYGCTIEDSENGEAWCSTKGQLISKGNFSVFNSPKE